jgi:hypothetical protein
MAAPTLPTTLHPIETPEQAIRRLAAQARDRGIRVALYEPTGEWYASSFTAPDRLHRVTRVSCDCPGFCRHGRCMHHAALLHHLGELPPETRIRRPPGCAWSNPRHDWR